MTATPSRLQLHMARGDDGIWHAWLYDPEADTILVATVARLHETLPELAARTLEGY